jgi:hypothetical protein
MYLSRIFVHHTRQTDKASLEGQSSETISALREKLGVTQAKLAALQV